MVRNLLSTRIATWLCGILFFFFISHSAYGQDSGATGVASKGSRGVYLVFPFENAGAPPGLDWLGEGLEELTIQYLSATGQQVYSHAGRMRELERYGLPSNPKLSRATMLRVAQDLDADFVIFGTFSSDKQSLAIEARVLRVDHPTLLAPVRQTGALDSLMDLYQGIVWKLLSANDTSFRYTLTDFSKAQRPLRLDAFEHYVRGLLANDDEARLRELREAVRLEPSWSDPDFALGEAYFSRNDCNSAVFWYGRVPKTNERHTEAVFAAGVCQLRLNQPDKAEQMFSTLQQALREGEGSGSEAVSGGDLPEILGNLGVAEAQQNKIPAAQDALRRAGEIDPEEDDYPFNLGLLAVKGKDYAAAAKYFGEASQRKPDNPEDRSWLVATLEKSGHQDEADQERESAQESLGPNALQPVRIDPKGDNLLRALRVESSLDTTALMTEVETPPPSGGPAMKAQATADSPAAHLRRGHLDLSAGKLAEADKEFRAALAQDQSNAAAHRGLGEIARRNGKLDVAAEEFQTSIAARDSAVVRTMLAKVYLEQKKRDLARHELEQALKLAPNYAEAKQLLAHLQNLKSGGGAQ
jgi:Tfp pilus assembly protein PilF/TolB-like protein